MFICSSGQAGGQDGNSKALDPGLDCSWAHGETLGTQRCLQAQASHRHHLRCLRDPGEHVGPHCEEKRSQEMLNHFLELVEPGRALGWAPPGGRSQAVVSSQAAACQVPRT